MTDTQTLTGLDTKITLDDPIYTHIIDRGSDERPAEAIVLYSRVHGTPLTALCGYQWVPSRDPNNYPACDKCLEIYEFAKSYRGV